MLLFGEKYSNESYELLNELAFHHVEIKNHPQVMQTGYLVYTTQSTFSYYNMEIFHNNK